MEIILLEKIHRVGDLGAQVNVRGGYGRNYLIPQGKAVPATAANKKLFEQKRSELETKAAEVLRVAQERAEQLQSLAITLATQASEEGKLFGSVSTNEIAKAIQDKGVDIAKREIRLPNGIIHMLGEYSIEIQLHSDVKVSLTVNIIAAK